MMNLVAQISHTGNYLQSWRHPGSFPDTIMNYDQMLECAKIAENAKFDAIFLTDTSSVTNMENQLVFEAATPWAKPANFEPITLMSALARETRHIGLVATSNTTYDEPYHFARRFASLDHLCGGRAGWNIVTGAFDVDALNCNLTVPPPKPA
jgi:alkanesulfonate monooxygenase SsuD/methylene tetrahydromethanopterin reductase-like flavin-dependent oxidoreductase (luciferase family)